FHTRDTHEVNWYLHRNVGCKTPSPDGWNYQFTSRDDPGIIYLPPHVIYMDEIIIIGQVPPHPPPPAPGGNPRTKATDWEVASLGNLSAADGAGAGVWIYDFRSVTAGFTEPLSWPEYFVGLGFGVGVDARGRVQPPSFNSIRDAGRIAWEVIRRLRL